jgi:SAM-dependent methyltransferase
MQTNGHTREDARDESQARPSKASFGATSLWQLFVERRTRDALYHDANYWDARASAREGLARSIWPSNVFNALWDERQRVLLRRALGDLSGRRVVDVGCGTGRMARWLASPNGAGAREVVGVDFSPSTVEAAKTETPSDLSNVRYVVGDVVAGIDALAGQTFDDAIVLGCFSVACRDLGSLERATKNVAQLVRPGGRLLLLEPIHRSPLLRRVLDLGVEDWVGVCNRAGLSLVLSDRMGFAPIRLVFSVRDLPRALVAPIFHAGERLLDRFPYLSPLSDYKLLLFRNDR